MHRTVVLDVVGLSRSVLGDATPFLRGFLRHHAAVDTVTPAVTCSVQATYLTGLTPSEHGIVGNGWYFREQNEIWLWRQSNKLVFGPKLWHLGRARAPAFTCANLFWWYNMATDADWSVTPRPNYLADGRKVPDCYSDPASLREVLTTAQGRFPLFQFWGPATSIRSSEWIAQAAMHVEREHQPTLSLVYIPHLDYVLQRQGPEGRVTDDLRAIDDLCRRLVTFYEERGLRVIILSEYGITAVSRAIHPNRVLREAGLLEVHREVGGEHLDPWRSRAFAVADHQIAHVYVRHEADIETVRSLFAATPGVERVLGDVEKREVGLSHQRAGELVLVADKDAWFTYYYWLDDACAPDFARTVDIHRKPGYDPCELCVDPAIRWPKLAVATHLARQAIGMRSRLELTPLDASLVRGSHGRPASCLDEGPLFATTEPRLLLRPHLGATEVANVILDHVFCD